MSSFLMANQHILDHLVSYNDVEDKVKEWGYNQGGLSIIYHVS